MLNDAWWVLRTAAKGFSHDEALTRAAALAFYTALSFAPLLTLLVWGASSVGADAQELVLGQLGELVGSEAERAAQAVLANAEAEPSIGSVSAWVSLAVLSFSATGVFAQLKKTLNRVWNVAPSETRGVREFVRTRLVSVGMLGALGFLSLVSLVVSAVVNFVFGGLGPVVALGSYAGSVVLFSVAFAAVYRWVPDCDIAGRDAIRGGFMTALLFAIGKEAIGLYLGRGSIGTAYGAAGSLVVLLVWVYYSGVVVLFGAELTQAYADRLGSGLGVSESELRDPSEVAIA